jgi:hypothetical protein
LSIGGDGDTESVLLEVIACETGDLGFVINDEDEFLHGVSIK